MNAQQRKIKIIFTTDIHGNYFPYDFRHDRWGKGSLQRVHGFVAQQCRYNPVGTILIDGGDILQGEPTSYYFNFVAKRKHHRVADFCNFIGYDVSVMGNHDIETGHDIFDDFIQHCNFPILAANAVSKETGLPYFEPYTILRRSGVKIAVLGFITAAIPQWVPQRIWEDMYFECIRESAAKWIQRIKETEQPDFIIGVFHSGMDEGIVTAEYKENEVRDTAENVDGFDLILYGHDHSSNMEEIDSPSGHSVMCINPGSYAHSVAEIDVKFTVDAETGKVTHKESNAQLRYIGTLHNTHTTEFSRSFSHDFREVKNYAEQKIGHFTQRVDVRDAYFGSSAYIDLIQELQLHISGADISFSAPLFFHASIEAGDVKVSHLFDLYRFEDHLFTIEMTGQEIKDYLEMSYANWTNQMPKPAGQKIKILHTDKGEPFILNKTYQVAMTAYRANGGGELLTKGAGLSKEEIVRRTRNITPHDIRHYLLEYVKEKGILTPQPRDHWRFVPTEWTQPAIERERKLLFDKKEHTKQTPENDAEKQ